MSVNAIKEMLQPNRIEYAISRLSDIGIDVHFRDNSCIKFMYKENEITLFPYTGWHTGKGIKDGRGIEKLVKQLT